MTAALIVGVLAAGGTYLVLQRGLVRVVLGFVLLGHAATTLLVAAGGVARRGVPIIGESGEPGDPLPQAFALTAIVIAFGITAFLLALAYRAADVLGDDDTEHDAPVEAARTADAPSGDSPEGVPPGTGGGSGAGGPRAGGPRAGEPGAGGSGAGGSGAGEPGAGGPGAGGPGAGGPGRGGAGGGA